MEQPFFKKKTTTKTIRNLNKLAIITLATKQLLLKQTIRNFNNGAILKTMKESLLKQTSILQFSIMCLQHTVNYTHFYVQSQLHHHQLKHRTTNWK